MYQTTKTSQTPSVDTNSPAFGDVGEEHDLDDLITKKFAIPHPGEVGDDSKIASTEKHSTLGEEDVISHHNSTTFGDGSATEASGGVGSSGAFPFYEATDDDFVHEITMLNKSSTSPQHPSSMLLDNAGARVLSLDDKETAIDDDTINHAQGVVREMEEEAGSNSLLSSGENGITQIEPKHYSGDGDPGGIDSDSNYDQHYKVPTQNSISKKSTILTESISAEEESKHQPPTERSNFRGNIINLNLKQTFEEQLRSRNIAREEAVRFAKYFRDGVSTNKKLVNKKRFEIPRPSPMLHHGQRNKVLRGPTIQEIFKRDRIQIHKSIEQLADKYKHNTLLSDLSKVTGKDWMDYKDGGKDMQNPVWMKFLKDAIEPKQRASDMNAENRQKLLGYMYKPNWSWRNQHQDVLSQGNIIYHKVRSNYYHLTSTSLILNRFISTEISVLSEIQILYEKKVSFHSHKVHDI